MYHATMSRLPESAQKFSGILPQMRRGSQPIEVGTEQKENEVFVLDFLNESLFFWL